MTKIEQTYIDKSDWKNGPWKSEPDRVSWVDPFTGYHCLVRRNKIMGFLCGYVAINKTHPFFEKDEIQDDYKISNLLSPHGGITFSSHCDGDTEKGICHLTKDKDDAWWFGFDCGYAWDIASTPYPYDFPNYDSCYRDLSYVVSEVELLAKQLKENEIKL